MLFEQLAYHVEMPVAIFHNLPAQMAGRKESHAQKEASVVLLLVTFTVAVQKAVQHIL
ncbi:hypothetical protein D3C71_2125820 [compost metagenome]